MSEYTSAPLQQPEHEITNDLVADAKKRLEAIQAAETDETQPTSAGLERLRAQVEAMAVSSSESRPDESEQEEQEAQRHSYATHEDLRLDSYERLLHTVQSGLSPRESSMSKLFHKPVVEAVSDATAKTIGRPIGLTSGAILATVGTSVVLFSAQTYGSSFSFVLFISLFIIGYLLATGVETAIGAVSRLRTGGRHL
jgi:hypothetical protein